MNSTTVCFSRVKSLSSNSLPTASFYLPATQRRPAVESEALSGLALAFLYGGARSLVVTLGDRGQPYCSFDVDLFGLSKKQPNPSHGEAGRGPALAPRVLCGG